MALPASSGCTTRITPVMLMARALRRRFVAEQHGNTTGFRQLWQLPRLRAVPLFVWQACMLPFRALLMRMLQARLEKHLLAE